MKLLKVHEAQDAAGNGYKIEEYAEEIDADHMQGSNVTIYGMREYYLPNGLSVRPLGQGKFLIQSTLAEIYAPTLDPSLSK